MHWRSRAQAVWRELGATDRIFLAVVACFGFSLLLPAGLWVQVTLALASAALGICVSGRWLRRGIRRLIWRLRNRLVVAYVFIAVVPVALIAILAGVGAWALAGQMAAYIVTSELDRRVYSLRSAAQALARVRASEKKDMLMRIGEVLEQRYPGIRLLLEEGGELRYPPEAELISPPEGWSEASGVVLKDELLHAWAHLRQERRRVTILAPLSREFLSQLAPGLGDVSLVSFPETPTGPRARARAMRLHGGSAAEGAPGTTELPPPAGRFDFEVVWGTPLPIAVYEDPSASERALLGVHSRFSAILGVIFSQKTESGLVLYALYFFAVLFLVVEVVSLVVGVSITRTITGAVHDLYEGTERVQQGDFSHRIEVRGKDQIAVVSESFNRMTENLERLLVVAKEKERLLAELEIAREVQNQLYPKTVPALKSLEIRAFCHPARMVSGDYYDYQSLHDSKVVLAIGDVAGKGISAALLMATLQSSLRTQVRACLERAAAARHDGYFETMSTSRLVSLLNQQLYADTSAEKYATFYFSIYDDLSGDLTYTNAGHIPPVLLRGGKAIPLEVNGMVVGAFPFAQYGESRLRLESGDLLVCYTDGITEPENEYGQMFGEQRLIEVVTRNAWRETQEIIEAVMHSVHEWTGSPEVQDDMTLLVARRR